MSNIRLDTLRSWARGDFYPLEHDEHDRTALDDLAAKMAPEPAEWWDAFRTLYPELDKNAAQKLNMPFAALLHVADERIQEKVASLARDDRRIANAFWDAMEDLNRSHVAYQQLGRGLAMAAFMRLIEDAERWEDQWGSFAVFYLTDKDPDEAWTFGLEVLTASDDPEWIGIVGAFIVEELLRDHGDAFINRIEAEAAVNDRLKRSLPITRWAVPDHLLPRVEAAAGEYWDDKLRRQN